MAEYKNGEYISDLSTFYPVRYGLYGAMAKSEGLMPSESSSYEGEDGDEDMTEYEGEAGEVGGVPEVALPTFRQLVKSKKLNLKATYGKGHFKKVGKNKTCADGPGASLVWCSGWRKKWRQFKQQGGLAQLKLQAIGEQPIPSSTPTPPPTPPMPPTMPPAASTPFLQNIKPAVKGNVRPRAVPIGAGPSADATQRSMASGKEKFITYGIIAVVVIAAIWLVMKTLAKKAA